MERDIDNGIILSESDSDSSEELIKVRNPLDEAGKQIIRKRRAAFRRKAKREFGKSIAESRYLKRRKSKRIAKIQRDCPAIGKTIEKYAKKCGVGASAWRRTGALTFDGNTHVGKKVTFKRIKEHLEEKYDRTFGYGTVVELVWLETNAGSLLHDIKDWRKLQISTLGRFLPPSTTRMIIGALPFMQG